MKVPCLRLTLASLIIATAVPARAQLAKGGLYGTVLDESGAVLPGATVTLASEFGDRRAISGASGGFRFLNLDHGRYDLSVSLSGFSTVRRRVVVSAGASVTLTVELRIAELEEVVEVTASSPVVDPKRMGALTTLTRDELDRIPQARDPWDLVKTAPGVIIARTNIAGVENDRQPGITAKGASYSDTTYSIDGQQIDDMAGNGESPGYWDFGAFDEIAFTTGGNALAVQTGGLGFNFVTKRGTNRWRGSARGYLAHDDFQWGNVKGSELENDPRLEQPDGSFSDTADRIQQIHEYGLDIGGPLIRDTLFIWGTYGRQDIRKVFKDERTSEAVLDGFTGKLSWHISSSTQASAFYSNNRKNVVGRASFASTFVHEDRSLWDQGARYEGFLPLDIHGLVKFEVNHVLGPDLIMNLKYLNWDHGFGFTRRDETVPSAIDFFNATARGTAWLGLAAPRPLKNVTDLTGSYFAEGWGGSHELKFGFGYRKQETRSTTTYGGIDDGLSSFSYGGGLGYAWVQRDGALSFDSSSAHIFLGDTFTNERLTITAGLRFDHQKSENVEASIPANPAFPELLPAIEFPGGGTGVSWNTVSPRLGITYALQEDRGTIARLSFSSYAPRLQAADATFDNPLRGAFQAYFWDDLDGDGLPSADEVDLGSGLRYFGGHDPRDPGTLETPNRIDPEYSPRKDYEIILGVDHELLPDLAVGAAYTWRRLTNWDHAPRLRADGGIFGPSDYSENEPVTANGFTANTFSPDPVLAGSDGRLLTNRPDYRQAFSGFDLTLHKRLSNRWMGRVAFSYMDHREHLDGPGAIGNPTRTVGSPGVDGGQVGRIAGIEGKGNRVVNAKWQFNANALYELPKGFEIAAMLFGRQGYAFPVRLSLPAGRDGRFDALAVPEIDSDRLPTFWNLDLRLGKRFQLGGEAGLSASIEMFNVFNSNTVLSRNPFATSGVFNQVDEITQPRILRLGARLSF